MGKKYRHYVKYTSFYWALKTKIFIYFTWDVFYVAFSIIYL